MNRSLDTRSYVALYLLIVLVSVSYLFVVGASVLRLQYVSWNGALAFHLQQISWPWFQDAAPHFVRAGYWIPYWCAVILLFVYKERVKFLLWVKRFGIFLIALQLIIVALNIFLSYFLPRLCGRTADFTHLTPHAACRFISPVATEVAGATMLVLVTLKRQHNMVKLLMVVCTVVIAFSLLNQGIYFPLQLLCSLLIACYSSLIAYLLLVLMPTKHQFFM